jgi:hypothetical protein
LWAVSDIVNPLNQLQQLHTLTLDVGSIGPFILRGLCRNQSLTKLQLDLCGIEEPLLKHLAAYSPQPGEFPALRELSVAGDMHLVNKLLPLILSTCLHRIAISTYSLILPAELAFCLQYLAHFTPDLLELRITTSFDGNHGILMKKLEEQSDTYIITLSDLLSLTGLKQLEILSAQLGYTSLLDNTDVAMLISGLPAIKEFILCPAIEWAPMGWKPRATLRCLEWVATHAKGLQSLGLSVDATAIPTPKDAPDDVEMNVQENPRSPPTPPLTPESSLGMKERIRMQTQSSKLETLFVGMSPVASTKAEEITSYLRNLFPSLRAVGASSRRSMGQDDGVLKKTWDEVSNTFKQKGVASLLPRRSQIELMESGVDVDMEMDLCQMDDAEASDGLDKEEFW